MKNKKYYKSYAKYAPEGLKGVLLHRYIYEQWWNVQIPDDCCIHHFDFNPDNNDILNLVMMTKHDHSTYHCKLNPHSSGWHHTQAVKDLIAKKIAISRLGTHHTEETKQKMRDTWERKRIGLTRKNSLREGGKVDGIQGQEARREWSLL